MPLTAKRVLKQFRYAMYFNGVNAYVSIPRSPSLNVGNSITIMMWVYPRAWPPQGCILDRNNYYAIGFYGGYMWSWLRLPTPGRASPTLRDLNRWYHIAVTYDGATRRHYVNGEPDGSWAENASLELYNSMRVIVGANANDTENAEYRPSDFFDGLIASVNVYSRALSGSEIQWNYQYPDNPLKNGLVLWLQADPQYVRDVDGDGRLEWLDLSGYNNHGKIYGARLVQLIKSASRVVQAQRVLPVVR